jgi:hypothetical protein
LPLVSSPPLMLLPVQRPYPTVVKQQIFVVYLLCARYVSYLGHTAVNQIENSPPPLERTS